MSFQEEYLRRAGLEPDSYEVVSEGDVVNTAIISEDGDKSVFQYAEGETLGNVNRGSKAYEWLKSSGVSVPEIFESELREDYTYSWHHIDFIEGRSPQNGSDWYNVGESLADIHEEFEGNNEAGYIDWKPSRGFEVQDDWSWNSLFNKQFWDTSKEIKGTKYEISELENVERNWRWYQPVEEPDTAFLHGDVSPYNVIVSEDSVTWIDFDQALFGDPDYEVLKTEQRLKIEDIDPEPFLEGYRNVRDFEERPRHKGYKALSVMKMLYSFKLLEDAGINKLSNRELAELNEELRDLDIENTPKVTV